MLRYYYFRFQYRKWFQNRNGIKGFSQQSLGWFIRTASYKSHKVRQQIRMLKDRKSKLLVWIEELETMPSLGNDEYFSIRKKIRFQQLMIPTIILIEVFLNYVSTLVFITGEGPMFMLIRWGIALVLTFMGTIVADKLLEAIVPRKPKDRIRSTKIEEDPEAYAGTESQLIITVILLSVLLLMTEVAIIGVAGARARDIEGGQPGGMLYYGFIMLSMALPLAAGYLRWDMLHDYDAYKNTHDHKNATQQLKQIDQSVIRLDEQEKYYFKHMVNRAWQILAEFITYKEVYNARRRITEDLEGHFSSTRDTFINEAVKEYNKQADAAAATKLQLAEKRHVDHQPAFDQLTVKTQTI